MTLITEGTRWTRQRETAVSGEGWVTEPVLIITHDDGRTEEVDRCGLTRDDLVAIAGAEAVRAWEWNRVHVSGLKADAAIAVADKISAEAVASLSGEAA
jgi:hypothetical protein